MMTHLVKLTDNVFKVLLMSNDSVSIRSQNTHTLLNLRYRILIMLIGCTSFMRQYDNRKVRLFLVDKFRVGVFNGCFE